MEWRRMEVWQMSRLCKSHKNSKKLLKSVIEQNLSCPWFLEVLIPIYMLVKSYIMSWNVSLLISSSSYKLLSNKRTQTKTDIQISATLARSNTSKTKIHKMYLPGKLIQWQYLVNVLLWSWYMLFQISSFLKMDFISASKISLTYAHDRGPWVLVVCNRTRWENRK